MESTENLREHEHQFRAYLARHAYIKEMLWTSYEDYIWDGRDLYVQLGRIFTQDLSSFVRNYEVEWKFGVELRLVAVCEGFLMCSMFVPDSAESAESMLISGVKFALPLRLPACTDVHDGVAWVRLLNRLATRPILPSPIDDLFRKSHLS